MRETHVAAATAPTPRRVRRVVRVRASVGAEAVVATVHRPTAVRMVGVRSPLVAHG